MSRQSASYTRNVSLFLIILAFPIALSAQSSSGTVSGSARDSSGAVVPQAQVTLTNVDTNEKRRQLTSADGTYTFPLLPPATYQLEAQHVGFKRFVRPGITVQVQQQMVIDIVMEVGETSQSVEVQATVPLLESTSSSLGQVVDSRRVVDLPLVGRNMMGLVALTAGAQPIGPQFGGIYARTSSYAQGFFSLNGSQLVTNDALLDGVSMIGSMFNTPTYSPVADAVQEFKVQTNNLSAEFGRTGGGVVNIVTQSGGNKFHGSLYEFFRNDHLAANNWFNNQTGQPRPHATLNQSGGTISGPVVLPGYNGHDRTFWFFNYEGLRDRRAFPVLFAVPTTQQLQGDFSHTLNASGQLITIADPSTTRPNPANPLSYLRDAFPNDVIPPGRIDPVAAKVRNLWAPPNVAGNLAGANNFVGNGVQNNAEDQVNARIDHTIRLNHRVFGRFSWSDDARGAYDFFHDGAGWAIPEGNGVPFLYNARNVVLGYTYTISPTLLLDVRYGFARQWVYKDPALTGLDLTTIGFPASFNQQVFFHALPAFTPSGYRALAPANADLLHRADNAHSLQGSLTKVLSHHALKVGASGRYMFDGELQPNAAQGSFGFDGRFTSTNPLAILPTSGQSVASFLLGVPSSGSIDFMPAISISYRYMGLFVQDDCKVNSKLTLNLGLRYELQTMRNERYNRLSWFDPNASNPIGSQVGLPNLKGGLQFAGVGGNPRRQEDLPLNNFGPRFGFAYQLNANTVLRGGYGIFFLPVTGDDIGRSLGGEGFFATTTFLSSTDGGISPANHLSNPFPNGLSQPPGSSQGLASQLGQDLSTVLRNNRTAYTQEWNLNIQRKAPGNLLVDAAYAGNKGSKLPININLNQLPDQYLSMGAALLSQVPNPFSPFVTVGTLSQPTVALGQLLRPYPQWRPFQVSGRSAT